MGDGQIEVLANQGRAGQLVSPLFGGIGRPVQNGHHDARKLEHPRRQRGFHALTGSAQTITIDLLIRKTLDI